MKKKIVDNSNYYGDDDADADADDKDDDDIYVCFSDDVVDVCDEYS